MKSKYAPFIIANLIVCFYISYRWSVISYLGILMLMVTHELGHYMCAVIEGRNPELVLLSGWGNLAVRYDDGERSSFISAGGMIVNFLFLPLFIGMEIVDAEPWFIVLLIIVGSLADIVNIIKMVTEFGE